MARFSRLIEAQLDGRNPRWAPLVYFDFKSGARRLWPGYTDLDAMGYRWSGTRGLGTLTPISSGPGGGVEEVTFAIAADDAALLAAADADVDESDGRDFEVWFQPFDARKEDAAGSPVDWQPFEGDAICYIWGKLGPISTDERVPGPAGQGAFQVSVTGQNVLAQRPRPPYAFWSQRSQAAQHAGDNIFILVSSFVDGSVTWPRF